jgi:hypothetical protein
MIDTRVLLPLNDNELGDYYPAFIASYRPTLCRVRIDEKELINILSLTN